VARVRLKDVAARAKVDPSTASRVLSGRLDLVKDETAKRVIDASRALGYTPNAVARGLRTQRTGSIGVVLPEFSNPVYAAVIDGIEQRAAERGLSVVIDAVRPDRPADFARLVSENRVDGLLFSAASDRSFALDVLESTAVPLELYFEHRNYLPALLLFWPIARGLCALKVPRAPRLAIACSEGKIFL